MSKKQFEEDAYNFATGCSDPRSGVDIFLEGADWGYDYAKAEVETLINALSDIANQRPHKEAALEMKKRAKEVLAKYHGTCGFCQKPCGNDWCPTKKTER